MRSRPYNKVLYWDSCFPQVYFPYNFALQKAVYSTTTWRWVFSSVVYILFEMEPDYFIWNHICVLLSKKQKHTFNCGSSFSFEVSAQLVRSTLLLWFLNKVFFLTLIKIRTKISIFFSNTIWLENKIISKVKKIRNTHLCSINTYIHNFIYIFRLWLDFNFNFWTLTLKSNLSFPIWLKNVSLFKSILMFASEKATK